MYVCVFSFSFKAVVVINKYYFDYSNAQSRSVLHGMAVEAWIFTGVIHLGGGSLPREGRSVQEQRLTFHIGCGHRPLPC